MSLAAGWASDAFFEQPAVESIDGGTTSAGALWHAVSQRWGHSMQSMCSYHGMFPAKVAHYFVQRYSRPGDTVLDPFSGRGTTALQARMEGRKAIANDLSPLGYVLSAAKVNPPAWGVMLDYIDELELSFQRSNYQAAGISEDIRMLYHPGTLNQLSFIRDNLLSKEIVAWSPRELMLAGALAGIMHGSWRRDNTSQFLSISMPNTFSMSPSYVKKFILENGLQTLDQDVFECLRDKVARLYLDDTTGPKGQAFHQDAASLLSGEAIAGASVDLVVTSPPYLRVVNYATANWIRLWLLGIDDVGRERGEGRRQLNAALDHQHSYDSYAEFMLRTLLGIQRVLKRDGVAVIVIGDVADPGKEPLPLAAKLWNDVGAKTGLRLLELLEDDLPAQNKVSRIWGDTKGQATNRDCALILTHRDGRPETFSEIDWAEPYKDGGPDAAHERLRRRSSRA